ncbi:hypothetical protein [Desulfatitalea tepidiphila]|uniref:hypothetical protein n=1 Tax=Desulfatitalea tepidiphila TaxID=1185843 RepID=UPI0006B617E7|nr:hypothetical protein [Desulfatitalea tepidiphila]
MAAYATAYQGNLNDAGDPQLESARQQLRRPLSSIEQGYKDMHDGKSLRIHFHLPPVRSLLRLWKNNQNKSDDLVSFRPTIVTISGGNHAPLTGVEIGANVSQASQGIQEMNQNANQSAAVSAEISQGIAGVSGAMDEMASNGSKIDLNAQALSELSDQLKRMVDQFKI